MGIPDVISLLGGIALFLFGMSLMGEGLKKVAGSKLELVLYRLSSTPLKGVLLGTGVTAVIQSSSATSVMVVGFVNSGMMKVRQAIGVIMGAILGTSITGWILCLSSISGGSGLVQLLSTEVLTGIVAVAGIILRMFSAKTSHRHVGEILLGFAVLMYGMSAMSGAVSPLRESESFIRILTSFSNPLLGILVGIAFTSILQSASAAVGILQALSITGAITFEIAFPIIMGVAIGAAVPVLLSALGANLNGKRTAFVYLLIDVLGVVIWSLVFYTLNAIFRFPFLTRIMTSVSIAFLNTLFRLATVIVLLPLIGLMEKLVVFLFPDNGAQAEDQDMDRLEERFLQHPALSIEQSRLVTNSMAERAAGNLLDAMALRTDFSEKGFHAISETESLIDRYEDKLGTYLMKITSRSLSSAQSEEVSKFLHTISDFERISDHALNISETAKEIHDKNMVFSPAALRELEVFLNGCGIQVNTWIPSAPLSSLVHAPAAELNLVKRVRWARRMREKFGTAYLHIGGAGRYAGLDGICTFYRDIGQALRMEAAVEPVVLAARAQALEETAEARRRLGQARAVLVSRSIQQAPFELKSYVRDYGLSVSHLCVILTPESRKNLNVTPALEDSLLARVREAAALYSPETQLLLNPAEETLRGIFAEADVVVGTGDFTLEGMGAPLIPAVNETTSLSFPSYVRTVRRMCRRLEHGTERSSLLLGKMPFQSRHYPLYCNQSNLAAKEMWSRMWLNRKGDSV